MATHQVIARNYSEASENRIHSDDVARRYGFRGALVPGVAVYAYLTHPLVERLGESWLSRSSSSVRFLKPAYEGDHLTVTLTGEGKSLHAACRNQEDTLLADLQSDTGPLPPVQSQGIFQADPKPATRVEMTWDAVVENQPFNIWHWQITEDANRTFAERVSDTLPIYRTAAHPHWILGIANRALTREYLMPAWIHVGSEIRFHHLLKVGDTVEVRAVPLEKWERKGHQFVKLYLAYLRGNDITTEIFHTAIFRVAD